MYRIKQDPDGPLPCLFLFVVVTAAATLWVVLLLSGETVSELLQVPDQKNYYRYIMYKKPVVKV